jgi:hypothetical protein
VTDGDATPSAPPVRIDPMTSPAANQNAADSGANMAAPMNNNNMSAPSFALMMQTIQVAFGGLSSLQQTVASLMSTQPKTGVCTATVESGYTLEQCYEAGRGGTATTTSAAAGGQMLSIYI